MSNAAHKPKVKISVRKVGQGFACESNLKIGRKLIWTSRLFPFGFDAAAIQAAQDKARELGYVAVSK